MDARIAAHYISFTCNLCVIRFTLFESKLKNNLLQK